MLNGFSKNKKCPICHAKLFQREHTNFWYCDKRNRNYYHFELNIYNVESLDFEAMMIGNHYIAFYQNRVDYYEYKNYRFCYESMISLKGNTVTFKDLDSSEKIEEFIKNYRILC